jgi:eukaryotic-like serine/threonine-protein kinase
VEGRVLAGRFRLTQMLGQGGMGSVWRAQHLELGSDIAVKLMDPSLASNPEGLARFRREAQAAASLKSPNVVQVFDYGVDGDTPYIAMEMLQGESLAKRIERSRRLTPMATATILSQVARALGKAHDAGIVHRDLKPENIFLVVDEDMEIAKVLDFGIAKRTGVDNMLTGAVQTQTGAMLGTPYYMSPEQAAGKKDVDHLTDVWSFGVIAVECLTGRRVFDVDTLGGLILAICAETLPNPSQLGPVPPQFDAWFACCVARERQVRFQSIREAAAALESVCREGADGQSAFSRGPMIGPVAMAATAPAAWQAPTGGLLGSTQTGPTSITVHQTKSPNRRRLLGLGLVAGVLLLGTSAFLWLGRAAPAPALAISAAAAPSLVTPPVAPTLPRANEVAPVVVPAPTPTPMVSAAAPPPTRADAAPRPGSQRNQSRAVASAARPRPPPAAPPPAAPPARPPARPNPVDLAF